MDALILAAGLGTRLRPLTHEVPKAMVEVDGTPMLERVARRLVAAGADRLVVNVHHLGEAVESWLDDHDLGADVRVSWERPEVLETGGGLWNAREHFRRDAPFFIHNADVVSTVDLAELYAAHGAAADPEADATGGPVLATLAVNFRETDRPLLLDDHGVAGVGHQDGTRTLAREPVGQIREAGFCGIHVVEPGIFDRMTERGRFSIITTYLRLVTEGVRVVPWDIGDALWVDVGTHERLDRAREIVRGEARG